MQYYEKFPDPAMVRSVLGHNPAGGEPAGVGASAGVVR